MASTRPLTQIHINPSSNNYELVLESKIDTEAYAKEEQVYQGALLRDCPSQLWYNETYTTGCPRPILVGSHHERQMRDLHEALTIAISDIIDRWWSDGDARLWERMPLNEDEEDLLKWLDDQVKSGELPPASERLGSWRPDFLVEDDDFKEENYRITEINARYSFNAFMHVIYGQQALNTALFHNSTLVSATDSETVLNGLFELYDPNYPLHLLKDEEKGIDVHMFIDAAKRRFGSAPRLITPDDLRILPDETSGSGYRLFCTTSSDSSPGAATLVVGGETWEEVHQVGLELRQHEIMGMQPEVLRQVSLRCFNDMRTILLVHDKRMLGIVRNEAPRLVARKVITSAQAESLKRGIVDTILPGSPEMRNILQNSESSPTLRNGYILKPIRSGKGDGIVFGDDITQREWIFILTKLSATGIPLEDACVVQRRIVPRKYDLLLKASTGMVRYPLVGTYHVINKRLLGLGGWRASGGRIVAVSSGGSWICSVVERKDREKAGVSIFKHFADYSFKFTQHVGL
ncbi:Ff.00g013120.m01.CDS01 [Fusarium sp. VM40]|nr:Ff.00g013120.m01.CDS01 [Fusarium sp. VM40]